MKREITVNLPSGVEYAFKGETEKAKFVTLSAPTAKNITDCSLLKKMFTNAAIKASEQNSENAEKVESPKESKESDGINGSDVMELIYAFGDSGDIEKSMIAIKNIFKNCGELDGEISLTIPLIDLISLDDFEAMVGEYISNFIAASMFEKKQKKV